MRIFLLPLPGEKFIPYAELAAVPDLPPDPTLKQRVVEAYQRVVSRFPLAERILTHLRKATAVEIVHSLHWTTEETRERLEAYLEKQLHKHRRWWRVDTVLAAAGAFLLWLPGPNIFFYYPAARSLSHYYAKKGGEQALAQLRTFRYVPSPELAHIHDLLGEKLAREELLEKIGDQGRRLGLQHLPAFYSRHLHW
ncbi:MAG: hypothetical protein HY652_09640 [Acidobacteria bacterium]|nr:hypothetical protein [Acidobacteriota bacterium]